jgi:hypothetical protein
MNQIMVNAVEFDALLKEVKYLKAENEKLKEQLKDSQGRIRVLKPELPLKYRARHTQMHRMGLTVTPVTVRIGMCVSVKGGSRQSVNGLG